MSNLTLFTFESMEVRLTDRDGAPWWVLADVCRVLEHSNPTVAASRLDDDEKDTLNIAEGIQAGPGNPNVIVINESGLYSLILTSRKPAAKRFKKWVTSEVLPTIRRTGAYAIPVEEDDEAQPVAGIAHLPQREVSLWLDMVRETRRLHGIHAARALWAQSPLPQPLTTPAPTAAPEEAPEWRRQGKYRPHQKFTQTEADAIRAEYKAGGCTTRSLAEKYGTSSPNISRIIRGASYRTDTRLH